MLFPPKVVLCSSRDKTITFLVAHISESACIIYRKYFVFVLYHYAAVIKTSLLLWSKRIITAEFIGSTSELVASQKREGFCMNTKTDLTT